jgi:hypothetical protein
LFVSHVVYGLRLAANLALPGLLVHRDLDGYDVRIRLKDWTLSSSTSLESVEFFYPSSDDAAESEPSLRVGMFHGGNYFGFFYRDGMRFAIERRGGEVWADWPENYTLEDACTYLIGPVIGFVLRLRGVTCLHASSVAISEQSIALVGSPGAGKSTMAGAFARRGFSVISDDVVVLAENGENFLVPPGYPRVNLWPDSASALFGSEAALPRITPTWDKRYLALGHNGLRFAAKPLPLGAIYLLVPQEAALTVPVVEEVAGDDALVALVANTYVNYLLDRDMRSREFDVLGRVVAGVPIRRVSYQAAPAAVFDLCEVISRDAKRLMVSVPSNATSRHD